MFLISCHLRRVEKKSWNCLISNQMWHEKNFSQVQCSSYFGPWWYPEGSCKVGSVGPSICLSICLSIYPSRMFLEFGLLFFSKFWHSVRSSYEVVCNRARFFGKFFVLQKLGKLIKRSKWGLQGKSILFAIYQPKPHIWEKYGSWDISQNALCNQIAGFLNQIYLGNKMMK